MRRATAIGVFISIALSVLAAAHYYVWRRLVVDPAWPAGLQAALGALFVLLFLGVPLTFFAGRVASFRGRRLAALPGHVWLGVIFILFTLVAATDLVRLAGSLLAWIASDMPSTDPAQRVTSARLVAGFVVAAAALATALALRSGLGAPEVKEVKVRLPRLPKELDGTTIVQVSDIHVGGATIGRQFVESMVSAINSLNPDIVAITGDLVDGSVRRLKEHVAPLEKIKTRYGAYFVTGNHEYYSGAEPWCRELSGLGIRVLRNERVSIGNGAASFDLAGIDDHEARRFGHPPSLEQAIAGRDPNRELVLLAHQPRAGFEAERLGVGLQISGHTHGGQIWPWTYLVYLQQPIVAGLARIGRTQVYVSRGTGYWGPPLRLHAPSEITKIVLESGA
jgi:predicted MPP superfamily phosphohydrolase